MRIIITISVICLAMICALPTMSQTSEVRRSDIIRLLGQLPEVTPMRQDMAALGFQGEKLDMAVNQMARMLKDPLIVGNIADRVIAAQRRTIRPEEARGLFWPLVDRGLGHLTLRELRYFYRVEQTMLTALPVRDCGLVIRERLSDQRMAEVTGRVASRLNTPSLREYYRIQYKAARLGVTRKAKRLSDRDAKRIAVKINRALAQRIAQEKDAPGLIGAFRNLKRMDNRRACAAGRLFIDAVLDLEGRDLHHALILLNAP